MKAKLERDLRLRNSFKSSELDQVVRRAALQTELISRLLRQRISFVSRIVLQTSRYRVHNYCILSGRSRSYIRYFRLSRIKMRELALKGSLFGIHKASW